LWEGGQRLLNSGGHTLQEAEVGIDGVRLLVDVSPYLECFANHVEVRLEGGRPAGVCDDLRLKTGRENAK